MLHEVEDESYGKAVSTDSATCLNDDRVSGSNVAPVSTVPSTTTTSVWGKQPLIETRSSAKTPSLAQIMAEQNEDKVAASVAFENGISLAEMEAQQELMFAILQGNVQDSKCAPQENEHRPPMDSGIDENEEEARILKMVMEQSLAEFNSYSVMTGDLHHRSEPSLGTCSSLVDDRPTLADREFSEKTLREIERTETVIESPHGNRLRRYRRSESLRILACSQRTSQPSRSESTKSLAQDDSSSNEFLEQARMHLSERELREIQQALRENGEELLSHQSISQASSYSAGKPISSGQSEVQSSGASALYQQLRPPFSMSSGGLLESGGQQDCIMHGVPGNFISEEDQAAIEAALRSAHDSTDDEESILLAMQMQHEEITQMQQQQASNRGRQTQGNVRTMTRAELDLESQRVAGLYANRPSPWIGAVSTSEPPRRHPLDQHDLSSPSSDRAFVPGLVAEFGSPRIHPLEEEEKEEGASGFRMNSASLQQWSRRDRNTIVGPNNEIRTKHDIRALGQSNAEWLGLDADDFGLRAHVGNQAFNSFRSNMKRTQKGVAAHGTGRAGSDTDGTRGKAMDSNVRLQISRAINAGLIEKCNGAVKQGKEAIVYHADQGVQSHGFDVAVKIFKRITEFRGRGEYVDGDPRYAGRSVRNATEREQLELWTEKEFRNLVRAHRARVPVPTPLHYKENIIFMRFMGNDGWPAPQIRDIDLRQGSKKWDVLYTQVMESIRRLYKGARLVHGDLSEYNILVSPAFQVDNQISSVDDASNDLQTVLIDFGQAVDLRHPHSMDFLRRDLDRVRTFFLKQGVKTLSMEDAVVFVSSDFENDETANFNESTNTIDSASSFSNVIEGAIIE